MHTAGEISWFNAGQRWNERALSAVASGFVLHPDSFGLLGGRMLEVLADKGARKARGGKKGDAEGRKEG